MCVMRGGLGAKGKGKGLAGSLTGGGNFTSALNTRVGRGGGEWFEKGHIHPALCLKGSDQVQNDRGRDLEKFKVGKTYSRGRNPLPIGMGYIGKKKRDGEEIPRRYNPTVQVRRNKVSTRCLGESYIYTNMWGGS